MAESENSENSGQRRRRVERRDPDNVEKRLWHNWDQRLAEARARRDKVLADTNRLDDTRRTTKVMLPIPVPDPDRRRSPFLNAQLLGRAFVVFAAALGVGLGGVLGLGLMAQADGGSHALFPKNAGETAVVQAAAGLDPVKASFVVDQSAAHSTAPPLTIAVLTPPTLAFEQDAAILPQITTVAFERRDFEDDAAQSPRQLPEPADADAAVGALGSGEAPLQVYLHIPTGVSSGLVAAVRHDINAAGVDIARVGREDFRVSTTHLRYYSAASAESAMTLARDLGIPARDFSDGGRSVDRIELWIAGRPEKAALTQSNPETFMSRLRERRDLR